MRLYWTDQENPECTHVFYLQFHNCYLLFECKPLLKQCRLLWYLSIWKLSKSVILNFWVIASFWWKSYVPHITILHKPENTKWHHNWHIRLYCTDTANSQFSFQSDVVFVNYVWCIIYYISCCIHVGNYVGIYQANISKVDSEVLYVSNAQYCIVLLHRPLCCIFFMSINRQFCDYFAKQMNLTRKILYTNVMYLTASTNVKISKIFGEKNWQIRLRITKWTF